MGRHRKCRRPEKYAEERWNKDMEVFGKICEKKKQKKRENRKSRKMEIRDSENEIENNGDSKLRKEYVEGTENSRNAMPSYKKDG